MAFLFNEIKDKTLMEKYELIREERLTDLNSDGCLLKHKKSGARIVLLSNDDENKVFSIGFRTPPYNDTGLQHIIEHTVLCGSKKYPVKDPFVELCKGSLNTFLNAMTYPDKTVYPVASCNIVDFKNIMDVYMDAVFYPNIYDREEIFMQEGWHYELENAEDQLSYNGVVYNEMKGAYSSPDELLSRYTFQSLFPDTTYSRESGGDPEKIPELTREEYLEYHRKFYHPANSYIYLYGNIDMEERLEYLDKEYLSAFDRNDVPGITAQSEIGMQKPFDKIAVQEHDYAITEEEPEDNNSYLSYNVVTKNVLDKKLYLAMQILDYVLVMAPGAVLKQELINNGIGLDVYSSYENSILQPVYSVIVRNASDSQKENFVKIIKNVLSDMVEKGIDRDTLLAGINYYEFKYREADFGPYPKGLMYGLQMMDSWLYDENEPFMHIEAGKTFDELKAGVNAGDGYFENVIKEYMLDNSHASLVVLNPKKNMTEEMEAVTQAKLDAYKASLSAEQTEEIVNKTRALKKYQDEPSTQEELKTIPMLSIDDISKTPAPLYNREIEENGVKVVRHDLFTNRISYIMVSFDCRNVETDDFVYLGILSSVLGLMDTDKYGYADLSTQINLNTGGIYTGASIYTDKKNLDNVTVRLETRAKTLFENAPAAFELIKEILFTTKFNDYKRLKEILDMNKSRMEATMTDAGHSVAMLCASEQFSKAAWYSNHIKGYDYYVRLCEIEKNFDSCKEQIADKLSELVGKIFRKDNLIISFNANDEGYESARNSMLDFIGDLPAEPMKAALRDYEPKNERLGLTSSSQVQYVARCGNYRKGGFDYTGALRVLKVIFSYDYLWTNVRVKGGAYGCMSNFSYSGDSYLLSYRDPNLEKTNVIYEGAPEFVRNFNVSDRDMTKFIIGTIGDMDTPLTPATKGARSFGAYMSHMTIEDYQKERDEVIGADAASIRKLADLLQCVVDQNYFCVVGNAGQIQNADGMFDRIEPLTK
ncbi:MAG: insulinase family protein [Clostridia bacterium]|nr:insulinase family protein [Clostridia bacterium]